MPPELLVREPTRDDVPTLAAFLNEHALALHGETEVTETEVGHWLSLPNVWFRVVDCDGVPVGYADVHDDGAEGVRFDIDARTLDAGAAGVLLAAAENSARTRARPGALIRGYSSASDVTLEQAYRRAGFRVVRHSFQMRINLDGGPPATEWPAGLEVRGLRAGEEERIHEVVEEAFQDSWDHRRTSFDDWRAWTIDHPTFDPSLWFVAEEGDAIAGVSLCAWHFSGDPAFGWVHALGVLKPWRRRGLGLALLRHSFHTFRERGATRVGLGVDADNVTGAVRLYERAGMHVARRTSTWEKPLV